jgi:hypothetical protein
VKTVQYVASDGTPVDVRRMAMDDRVRARSLREAGDQVALSEFLDGCLRFYGHRIVKPITLKQALRKIEGLA